MKSYRLGPVARSANHRAVGSPAMEPVLEARPEDHALAARLAGEAGSLLLDLRVRAVARGGDAATLRAEGDRQSHELLMAALAEAVPGDAVLSEEGVADPARLTAARVWIVDPLDGTREFAEPPRSDWAVHVALVIDGTPV